MIGLRVNRAFVHSSPAFTLPCFMAVLSVQAWDLLSCPSRWLDALMRQRSQDYWSEPTDIWFEKRIQKQYTPCHGWAGCITDWLTDCSPAAGEKPRSLEALTPRRGLPIHSNCQQWSLILWPPLIPVGVDCVEYLSIQYLTHLPAFHVAALCLSYSCTLSTPSSFVTAGVFYSPAGLMFHLRLIHTSASAESECSGQFHPSDVKDKAINVVMGMQHCRWVGGAHIFIETKRMRTGIRRR